METIAELLLSPFLDQRVLMAAVAIAVVLLSGVLPRLVEVWDQHQPLIRSPRPRHPSVKSPLAAR